MPATTAHFIVVFEVACSTLGADSGPVQFHYDEREVAGSTTRKSVPSQLTQWYHNHAGTSFASFAP
jgi:hypothetical protein